MLFVEVSAKDLLKWKTGNSLVWFKRELPSICLSIWCCNSNSYISPLTTFIYCAMRFGSTNLFKNKKDTKGMVRSRSDEPFIACLIWKIRKKMVIILPFWMFQSDWVISSDILKHRSSVYHWVHVQCCLGINGILVSDNQ